MSATPAAATPDADHTTIVNGLVQVVATLSSLHEVTHHHGLVPSSLLGLQFDGVVRAVAAIGDGAPNLSDAERRRWAALLIGGATAQALAALQCACALAGLDLRAVGIELAPMQPAADGSGITSAASSAGQGG